MLTLCVLEFVSLTSFFVLREWESVTTSSVSAEIVDVSKASVESTVVESVSDE